VGGGNPNWLGKPYRCLLPYGFDEEDVLGSDIPRSFMKLVLSFGKFDIFWMVEHQKEVNEISVERIAKNANPLALIAAAQPHPYLYYQAPKSHKSYAPRSKTSPTTRSHATTRHKGKETAKPITPPYESASEEDSDLEQAQKDKEMQKNVKYKRINDLVDVIIMSGGRSKTHPTTTMVVVKNLERN
nr:hypothetical protein [Tanacetum cinerariifolium]